MVPHNVNLILRDGAPLYQIWLRKVTKIQQIWKKQLIFEDLTTNSDLDLEDKNLTFSHDLDLEDKTQTFLHDTPDHDDAPSYQVWLHTV